MVTPLSPRHWTYGVIADGNSTESAFFKNQEHAKDHFNWCVKIFDQDYEKGGRYL
jgi:hypothetical protein